ncbi:MAG: hypothetical protein WDM81_19620 [Rhizomicrobium sp.]
MTRQVAAILDEERRIALEIFVVAVREARREAASVDHHGFGGDLRSIQILLDHHAFAGRMGAREQECLVEIGDLRHALHARLPRESTGLITRSRPRSMATRCKACGVGISANQGTGITAFGEAPLHGELVAGEFGAGDRNAGKTQALRHPSRR